MRTFSLAVNPVEITGSMVAMGLSNLEALTLASPRQFDNLFGFQDIRDPRRLRSSVDLIEMPRCLAKELLDALIQRAVKNHVGDIAPNFGRALVMQGGPLSQACLRIEINLVHARLSFS